MSIYITGVSGSSSGTATGGAYSGLLLVDSNSLKWSVTVLPSGNLSTGLVGSVPSGALYPGTLITQDSAGNYWTISVSTLGNLITTAGGTAAGSVLDIVINDSAKRSWILTVSTTGNLITT